MRRTLLIHLLLTGLWAAMEGRLDGPTFVTGFVVALAVLWLVQPLLGGPRRYASRLFLALGLGLVFSWELLLASLRVAWDIVTPRHRMRPGIIAVPLDVRTDAEITVLAALITLTPGSVCLDLSEDKRTLYLHAMYLDPDDLDRFRARIKSRMERRVQRLFAR